MIKTLLARARTAFKAARQLGPVRSYWYAVYQTGLRSGLYRRATPAGAYPVSGIPPMLHFFPVPDDQKMTQLTGADARLVEDRKQEAEEIIAGQVRLFGGPPVPLELKPPGILRHWTELEGKPKNDGVEDIKFVWEPARFGFVYPLARAFRLTADERYPAAFWKYVETFLQANPPNLGPNWLSAQEVALRLLAWLFAASAFQRSVHTTPEREHMLAGAIAAHAERIPATLSYARAQNNNHLLTEALGLYAAGCSLPDFPPAARWRELGWRAFNQAILDQIEPDGTYTQHSTNYHRLMLQAALQAQVFGQPFPAPVRQRLASAALWLAAQTDPVSGGVPNLGSNDGALILPLAPGGFRDYRPTVQSAARAFLGRPAYGPGPWDELCLWLGVGVEPGETLPPLPQSPSVPRLGNTAAWAAIRAVHFSSRPSHADQLHVDLWSRGENIALDAGTYRYTAPNPWDNSLAQTLVHNTVVVDEQNQMQRAGRFLWLDWAQGRLVGASSEREITAEHTGYLRLGVLHRRTLAQIGSDHWRVTDQLLPAPGSLRSTSHRLRLHWLLPDWPWQIDGASILLERPDTGTVRLSLSVQDGHLPVSSASISLVRASQPLYGPSDVSPLLGWRSPTYGQKLPALSFSASVALPLPVTFTSDWLLK